MILTDERAELLANYLTSDTERAKGLISLEPEEALEKINADGNDFTIDEIKEFGIQLQSVAAGQSNQEELNAEDLGDVSGGVVVSSAVLGAGVTLFVAGVGAGYKVARDRGW